MIYFFCIPQQVSNNIVFLCMTDADAGSDRVRVPYAFLEDIKDEFSATYGDRAQVGSGTGVSVGLGGAAEWTLQTPPESP